MQSIHLEFKSNAVLRYTYTCLDNVACKYLWEYFPEKSRMGLYVGGRREGEEGVRGTLVLRAWAGTSAAVFMVDVSKTGVKWK